jgi:hypothetical protein
MFSPLPPVGPSRTCGTTVALPATQAIDAEPWRLWSESGTRGRLPGHTLKRIVYVARGGISPGNNASSDIFEGLA